MGPESGIAGGITRLLAHKGPEWQFHMDSALRGQTDLLETRYYLGLLDGVPVGNVMTVEYLGVGILGHVYTVPEQRRKGICQAIMGRLMADFRERGGHVLQLGTGYESHAYWIYHSFGFRSLKGGFMRYDTADDSFEKTWFAPATVAATRMAWRHWPLAGLLGAHQDGEILRSAAWRLYGIGNLETPVVRSMKAMTEGAGADMVVLETARGAVTGVATLHPTSGVNGWPGVWLLDFFAHPDFASHSIEMLHTLNYPSGKIISYVETGARDKARALEQCDFKCEGTLAGFLRTEDSAHDVWLYGKIAK